MKPIDIIALCTFSIYYLLMAAAMYRATDFKKHDLLSERAISILCIVFWPVPVSWAVVSACNESAQEPKSKEPQKESGNLELIGSLWVPMPHCKQPQIAIIMTRDKVTQELQAKIGRIAGIDKNYDTWFVVYYGSEFSVDAAFDAIRDDGEFTTTEEKVAVMMFRDLENKKRT